MKNTVSTFLSMKQNGERLTEITSYDYTTAKLVEKAGINAILVGDSLGRLDGARAGEDGDLVGAGAQVGDGGYLRFAHTDGVSFMILRMVA